MKISKLGLILAGTYLLFALLIIGGDVHTRVYGTEKSELDGLLSLTATLPISILLMWALDSLGIDRVSSNAGFVMVFVIAAVGNAFILYLLGAMLGYLFGLARK